MAPPMLEESQVFKEAMGASPTTKAEDSSRAWGEKSIFCYRLHLRSSRLLCLHRLQCRPLAMCITMMHSTVLNSFMRRIRHTPTRMKGSEAYADTDDTDHIKCYRALSLPSDATKQARHSFSKSVSTTALRSPLYDFSHVVA